MHRPLTSLALALVAAFVPARAQEPAGPEISPQSDAQRELVEIFGRVERRLRAIDELLSDAAAGDTKKLADAKESGIGELLRRSQDEGRQVRDDIDRILELAQQMGQQQQSSGGGQQGQNQGQPSGGQQGQQQGQSRLDGQGGTQGQQEATPSQPERGGEQGGKDDGKTPQSKPGAPPKGEQPGGDQASRDPGANRQGQDPSKGSTDRGQSGNDGADRWGDLPERAREVFRQQGGTAMPARYRDWIDSYYRRLAKKP